VAGGAAGEDGSEFQTAETQVEAETDATIRSTAGAITTVVAIVFVLPAMLQIVGSVSDWTWVQVVWNYLPTSLGSTLGMGFVQGGLPSADPAVHSPGYLEAMAALAAWVVLPTVAAAEAFLSRDAK